MSRGKFITLEGMDGAGKTTHLEWLRGKLVARGLPLTVTREPGGTALGEALRKLLLDNHDPRNPDTEALLMFAARREHIAQVIEPALVAGHRVLCDRFTDATFAYQGGGRGFDLEVLSKLELWAQAAQGLGSDFVHELGRKGAPAAIVQPDLTVWFDLAPEEAAQRLVGARVPDKFEAQPVEFFRRVAQGYADRMAQDPARFARIDAAHVRETVWHAVYQVFADKGWLP